MGSGRGRQPPSLQESQHQRPAPTGKTWGSKPGQPPLALPTLASHLSQDSGVFKCKHSSACQDLTILQRKRRTLKCQRWGKDLSPRITSHRAALARLLTQETAPPQPGLGRLGRQGSGSSPALEGHPETVAAMLLPGHCLKVEANPPMATPWQSQEFFTMNSARGHPALDLGLCHREAPTRSIVRAHGWVVIQLRH